MMCHSRFTFPNKIVFSGSKFKNMKVKFFGQTEIFATVKQKGEP